MTGFESGPISDDKAARNALGQKNGRRRKLKRKLEHILAGPSPPFLQTDFIRYTLFRRSRRKNFA
jgi:hypothetical protein